MSGGTEPLPERAMRRLLDVAAADDDRVSPAALPLPERYEVRRELGRGGMGIVYQAFDRKLGRLCAVKILGAATGAGDELRRRFAREARAAASLRHPHIAAIHDATEDYISMQWIDGGPLQPAPGDPRAVVAIVRDAALALQHAHEQGIVHRDVKPSNLLVERGHVFVVDFGLAKSLADDASHSLTGIAGTPAFMAPEQATGGGPIDARCDVYGLGATLYYCLCGRPPFRDGDLPTLLRRVVEDDPDPLRADRDLELVARKCLAKEPERRYASARELADDLDRWLRQEPVSAQRPSVRYRLGKFRKRHRRAIRAALVTGLAAMLLVAAVLVPITWRESAARAAADRAVRLSEQAAAILQEAVLFERLGDRSSAQQVLDGGVAAARAFLADHDVPRVRFLLSRLLRARGQRDDAMAELQRTLAAEPDLDEARFERGLLLAARRELTDEERGQAIADLGVSIGARSVFTSIERLFGRAERLRLLGENERASAMLTEVLSYDATHVPARLSLARAALALGQDDLARYYSASALDLQRGYGPFFIARERQSLPVSIYGLDMALVDFAAELIDDPDAAMGSAHRGLVQLRRALRLEGEGDLARAIDAAQAATDDYSTTLSVHEDLPGALNNRGVCELQLARLLARQGDPAAADARARAAADFARVLEVAGEHPEALFNAGILGAEVAAIWQRLGRADAAAHHGEQAATMLRRALAAAPEDWLHRRAGAARLAK